MRKEREKSIFVVGGFASKTLCSEVPRDYVFRICFEKGSIKLDPHCFEAGKPIAEPNLKQ